MVHARPSCAAIAAPEHARHRTRIDTALFLPPAIPDGPRRGRPRIYGDRLRAQDIEALPATELPTRLYGKQQRIRLRSTLALARFLKGAPVCAVWCQFYDDKRQSWARARLILATETDLDAEMVTQLYGRRWGIEPLFHNRKPWWGLDNVWQQTRTVLELWIQIRLCAWALTRLLSLAIAHAFPMGPIAPWRFGQPVTAGLVAQWLRREFTGLADYLRGYGKSVKFPWSRARVAPCSTG